MVVHDKLRLELLTKLSYHFGGNDLKIISEVLTGALHNYEISQRNTDIVVYQDGLPSEIVGFLAAKAMKGLTKASLQQYRRTLTHFSNNINKDIKSVNANDIRFYFYSYEKSRNVGKSTLDDKRRILNTFYNWMVAEDIISKSPMAKIEPIQYITKEKEPLSVLELEKLRHACEDLRETALLEVLYSTMGRISEILALNKSDINFDTGKIKVFGKGQKERFVFLNAKAEIALKKYLFSRTDDNEALFVVGKKPYHRMGKGTAEKIIKNLGKKAELDKDVYPHLLRATAASHALARGMDLVEVSKILGHASTQVTLRYAKMNYDDLQHSHKKCVI